MRRHQARVWRRALAVVTAAAAVAIAAACGDGGAGEPTAPDGATPEAAGDGAIGDAGRDASPPNLLVRGDIEVFGITLDGYVGYRLTQPTSASDQLGVVSLSGGPPTVLSDDLGGGTWYTRVVGRAFAFWTGAGEDKLGTFNVWTKAHGIKSAPGYPSLLNFVAASFGSDMVVFASAVKDGGIVDGVVQNVSYAATSAERFDAKPVILDVNLAASRKNCPVMAYAPYGETMFLTYCTGTDPNAVFGRVALARREPDGTVSTSVLVSEIAPAEAMVPFFGISADSAGSTVFMVGAQPAGEGRVIDVATRKATPLDPNVSEGLVSPEAGTVYYVSSGAYKRAALDGTQKVTLVEGGVDHTVAVSTDERRILFASGPRGLTDLKILDTATERQTPTTLLTDASASAAYFLESGEELVYTSVDPGTGTADCHLVVADGGNPRTIGTGVRYCGVIPKSSVVIFADKARQLGPFLVADLWMLDAAKAGSAPVLVDSDVSNVLTHVTGGLIGYVKRGAGAGLYARKLP